MSLFSLIRRISPRLFTVGIVFLIASCSSKQKIEQNNLAESFTEPRTDAQEIALQVSVPEYLHLELAALVGIFEKEHPNIQIQLISQDEILAGKSFDGYGWPTDAYLKLARTSDVFLLPATPDAVQAGIIRDLEPFFAAEDVSFQTDTYPGTLDSFRWDGGLWSLPTGINYTLLYYNKALFDTANLPYPTNNWSWDQFFTIVDTLTTEDNGVAIQWGFLQPSDNHAPILISLMTQEFTTQQLISPVLFTMPQFEAALDTYSRIFPENIHLPDQSQIALQQINEGQVAMWTASNMQYDQFADQVDVGVVTLPANEQYNYSTPLYVSGISMSSGTRNPDAAWKWMRFLSNQKASWSLEKQIPARVSVAEASGIWNNMSPELATAVRAAIEQSYPANFIFDEQHLDEVITGMISGDQTVADVVQAMTLSVTDSLPIKPTVEVMIEAQATAVPNSISIDYVANFTQDNLILLKKLAEQFMQENPGFNVTVLSGTELDNFSAAARSGQCFEWSPILASKDMILPLDPLIAADAFDLADYYPGLLADFQQNGTQWGIPASADIYVLKYNKELFDQAGIEYPHNGWSTAEFLETALALTSGNGDAKIYGFVAGRYEWILPNYFLEPLGAKLINENMDPPTMRYDDPETVKAMRWLTDLSLVYGVKPVLYTSLFPSQREEQAAEHLIADGRTAMWLELGSTPDNASPNRSDMHIGAVSFPIGSTGGNGGYQHETGFFISANTDNLQRQACWQWITYLSEHATSVKEAPARRSILTSEQYRQLVGDELADAYITVFEKSNAATIWSRTSDAPWMLLGMNWQLFAYMNIIAENQSVEEALTLAQSSFDEYRACIIAHEGFTDHKIQRECYCEGVDSLPSEIASITCSQ